MLMKLLSKVRGWWEPRLGVGPKIIDKSCHECERGEIQVLDVSSDIEKSNED
jgi:hypothetical protein